jgi:dimethylaniline monooxygenase (N-oxide forming)
VWRRTLASTRLQKPASTYRFSDFPWPAADAAPGEGLLLPFPRHDQVVEYLTAYARRFGILERVRFGCNVLAASYVGATEREVAAWERWSGNGEAFGDGSGEWHLTVRHGVDGNGGGEPTSTQVLLCSVNHWRTCGPTGLVSFGCIERVARGFLHGCMHVLTV